MLNRNQIITECVSKQHEPAVEKNELPNFKIMMEYAIEAAEKKQEFSVDFVRNLHAIFTRSRYQYKPGGLRELCTGSAPDFDKFTPDGLFEIINIIREEKKAHFPEFKGSWIGVFKKGNFDWDSAVHSDNVDNTKLITDLFKALLTNNLAMVFARTNNSNHSTYDYVTKTFDELVENFNQNIVKANTQAQKLEAITLFIKNSLRTGIFNDLNHQVFIPGVLNFLLIKHLNSYCALDITKANFIGHSLIQSVELVSDNLRPVPTKTLQEGLFGFFAHAMNYIAEVIKNEDVEEKNKTPSVRGQ